MLIGWLSALPLNLYAYVVESLLFKFIFISIHSSNFSVFLLYFYCSNAIQITARGVHSKRFYSAVYVLVYEVRYCINITPIKKIFSHEPLLIFNMKNNFLRFILNNL